MQKLHPYILPGLFLFHLLLLCVIIVHGPTDVPRDRSATSLERLWVYTSLSVMLSQFLVTALWAGLGPEPWFLRVTHCAALAALTWTALRMFWEQLVPGNKDVNWMFIVGPGAAWAVLVGLLISLRTIPFLNCHIVLHGVKDGPLQPRARASSLTHGVLFVVAVWGGILMLLKDSHPWPALQAGLSQSRSELWQIAQGAAILSAVLLPLSMLLVALALGQSADRNFYRRRWPLTAAALAIAGLFLTFLLCWGPATGDPPFQILLKILFPVLLLTLVPLLAAGLAGYRLAGRGASPQSTPSVPAGAPAGNVQVPLFQLLPPSLQGASGAALAALVVLSCVLVPTGLLTRHKIRLNSQTMQTNDAGEITNLRLWSSSTDDTLAHLRGQDSLRQLDLSRTQISDTGLVHLAGLANLEGLNLDGVTITDDGLPQLTNLSNLQVLYLTGTRISDAGLVHLQRLTNLRELYLFRTGITATGLAHLKSLQLQKLTVADRARNDLGLKHYLAALDRPTQLELSRWNATDAGITHLRELTSLQRLDLLDTGVTDAGLEPLGTLKNLQVLHLPDQITDAGLVHLKGLTNLKELHLPELITDAGLGHLAGMVHLQRLFLTGTGITDAGLAHLAGLPRLQKLLLTNCQIQGAGLLHLKTLTNLNGLSLSGSGIGDAGVLHLRQLTGLQVLDLNGTGITDAGLIHLKDLTNLRALGLRNTRVSEAGLAGLKKTLPGCDIRNR
ncbi:MAG: hypothetical protein CMJ81_21975 [Planctomycetaceae bacterium]|nr:hypothetical protein [Planctomycetaceae bacterium]